VDLDIAIKILETEGLNVSDLLSMHSEENLSIEYVEKCIICF
jgi:hypothetical protein